MLETSSFGGGLMLFDGELAGRFEVGEGGVAGVGGEGVSCTWRAISEELRLY